MKLDPRLLLFSSIPRAFYGPEGLASTFPSSSIYPVHPQASPSAAYAAAKLGSSWMARSKCGMAFRSCPVS